MNHKNNEISEIQKINNPSVTQMEILWNTKLKVQNGFTHYRDKHLKEVKMKKIETNDYHYTYWLVVGRIHKTS